FCHIRVILLREILVQRTKLFPGANPRPHQNCSPPRSATARLCGGEGRWRGWTPAARFPLRRFFANGFEHAMRLSRSLVPTLKETPAEAQIASHRLMLRAGLVRQTAAGIYAWLPAGWRVLRAISQIVREEQDAAGAQEILIP